MVNTELTYLKDFLGKVHTATVKTYTDTRDIRSWNATKKMLIMPPEIMGANLDMYKKRYNVLLSESSEDLLMVALNNILDGIIKLNKRIAIATYTRPGVLLWGQFISATLAEEVGTTKRWSQTIVLEFEWSTS